MTFTKESHIRSVIKGISWRVIATTDTIVIVLLLSCFVEKCSIENAIKIGALEFLIKLIIYYFHERFWQYRWQKKETVSKKETLYKTITWRSIATITTFLISGAILNAFNELAFFIAITELITKFVQYYFHERIWLLVPLGSIRRFVNRLFFNE